MFNPYVLLGVAVFFAVSCMGSYLKGYKNAENAAKAQYSKALEETIKQARENAVIDMQAAVEAETERQKARVEYRDRVVTVEEYLNANPLPADCRIHADGVRLLNDAIRSINGAPPAAKPKPVPTPPPAPRRSDGLHSASVH